MWDVIKKVIPVVMGALGSVPKMNLKSNLKVLDVEISVEMIRKCALLGSARILRIKGVRDVEDRKSNRYVPRLPQEHHQ